MLVRRAGGFLCVSLIEYAQREQPQYASGQGYDDTIAASLGGTASQGLENARGAKPTDDVVAEWDDRRHGGLSQRPLDRKRAGYSCTDFVEANPI